MTDAPDIRPDLRLRPEPPRVTRLSRKVLIALGGVGAIAIMGAFFWALNVNRRGNPTPAELYSTENRTTADGLAGLPKDYTGIPKLGSAAARRSRSPDRACAERRKSRRAARHPDAARRSGRAATHGRDRGGACRKSLYRQSRHTKHVPANRGGVRHRRGHDEPFTAGCNAAVERGAPPKTCRIASLPSSTPRPTTGLSVQDRVEDKASSYIVQAGAIIPAALLTGIKSDLPGEITAQTTEMFTTARPANTCSSRRVRG